MEPRNRFQGISSASLCSLCFLESILELPKSLQIRVLAGRCDNPLHTRFLAPIDCSKIPAQCSLQRLELIQGVELMQGLIIFLLPLTITAKQYLVETKNSLESLTPVLRLFLLLCQPPIFDKKRAVKTNISHMFALSQISFNKNLNSRKGL